jgi:hypothetical protein
MARLAFHNILSFGVQNPCFQVKNDCLPVFSYYRQDLSGLFFAGYVFSFSPLHWYTGFMGAHRLYDRFEVLYFFFSPDILEKYN